MRLTAALLLLPAAACAAAEAPRDRVAIAEGQGEARGCSLEIAFGSYAMGIDRAATAIEERVAAAAGVEAVSRHRWGREGEYTLCVRTGTARAAERLFDSLRPLLPERPRGPIEVRLADGRSLRAPPR